MDVTWDDPANPGKDPNDHKHNRYDYFLISDEELQKNHTPERWKEEKHTCAQTYDRTKVYKAAIDSGVHGDGVFVQSVEEANAAIKKYMDEEKTQITLWSTVRDIISGVKYKVETLSYVGNGMDGVTKISLSIYKSSEWNAIPVVTNAEEFQALVEAKIAAGETSFTARCEPADGNCDVVITFHWGTYYNHMATSYYNDHKSRLLVFTKE